MPFPTINDADTTNGVQTSNSTSWTLTYPGNIVAGNLLICFFAIDGTGGFVAPAGGWFSRINNHNGANLLGVMVKSATGSESGTFSVTTANEQGGWRIYRISDWYGGDISTIPNSDSISDANTITGSPSNAPNPPSVNPSLWDVEETLWIAACSADTSRTISVYPLADRNTADVSGGAGGATLGLCTTESAVASLDPGTFTISASDDWVAATVAIRPAALKRPPHMMKPRYRYN